MFVPKTNLSVGLLILRLSLAVLMIPHGVHKLIHGLGFVEAKLLELGLPGFLGYGVYGGELFAPILMLAGYRTRFAGALMAGTMATAIFLGHREKLLTLTGAGGWEPELTAMFMFGGLVLFFTGGGDLAYSKDHPLD